MERKQVLIVANPCSGKGKTPKVAHKVLKIVNEHGFDASLKFTTKSGDAKSYAEHDEFEMIIVIGGDGTLNEVVSGLVVAERSDVSVGYIPMGSTNDFARSLKIPRKWRKALDIILEGEAKPIDVCRFNDRYFIYVAAYGIFAETSCSVRQKFKNSFGYFAYLFRGIGEVFRKNNYHVKLEIGDRVIDDYYALLGFGNTRSLGGVLKFKDEIVDFCDGAFEVLLVKKPKGIKQLSRMLKRFSKSDWQGDGLELIHSNKVKVYKTAENMLWSLDGEKCLINEDVEVENIKHAINLIVK